MDGVHIPQEVNGCCIPSSWFIRQRFYMFLADGKRMSDLSAEIDHLRRTCINCGKCSAVCPSLKHGGFDPKEMMVAGEGDVTLCIQCGKCSQVCTRTDPFRVMRDSLALLKDQRPNDCYGATGFILPPAPSVPDPGWDGKDVLVVPGCVVESRLPYLKYALRVAVDAVGKTSSELPGWSCCLRPSMFSLLGDIGRKPVRRRMATGAEGELVSLCGGCSEEFSRDGIGMEQVLLFFYRNIDRLPVSKVKLKVALEPGCTMDRYYKKMRAVVERMGFEVVNTSYGCCGSKKPPLNTMMDEREEECSGADLVVLNCPYCMTKYDKYENGVPCVHLVELISLATGDTSTLQYHQIPVHLAH